MKFRSATNTRIVQRFQRWFFWASTLGLLGLLVSCTTPQPTSIPEPTLTPTLTPTPFTVAELPTVNPELTPSATAAQAGETTPAAASAAGPGIVRGAPLYTLPDSSRDQIRSIELHPTQKEMLVTLYNGVDEKVERVRWDGPEPAKQVISAAPLQIRYAPDGNQLIADGLTVASADTEFKPLMAPGKALSPGATPSMTTIVGSNASWSPDGTRIAFIRQRPDITPECEGQGAAFCASLVIYDFTTQTEQIIATSPYLSGPAQWSPDQTKLLANISGEVGSSLVIASTSGGALRTLIPNFDAPPDANTYITAQWLPDSRTILYATQASALYTIPASGGLPQPFINDAEKPHLVPGTQIVVFLRPMPAEVDQRRTFQLWQVDLTATDSAQPLSTAAIVCNNATWALDGKTLACVDVLADGTRAILLYGIKPRL